MPPLSGSWANALKGEFSKDYYKKTVSDGGSGVQNPHDLPTG